MPAGWGAPIEDDQDLVEAAQAGDRGAVDRLLRRHYDPLFALCRRMTGNEADAADAVQEALIAIARGLAAGRFDGRSRFTTWAFRVTTNATLDELRRRRRRPEPVPEAQLAPPPTTASGRSEVNEDALADRLDIDAALQQLPAHFRAAVVLRDLCQLDYALVAEVLDLPIGTVRSRIARGRAALARQLGARQLGARQLGEAHVGNQTTSTTRPRSSP